MWLASVFVQVYDDYFRKLGNKDAERYLELLELTNLLEVRIAVFKSVLQFHWETEPEIWNHPLVVEVRRSHIEALNKYLDHPFDLDADFNTEMQTALNVSLGIIQNDHSEAMMELEDLRKQSAKTVFEFYDSLQSINEANNQQYSADLLLPQYVAAEKSAIKKSEKQRLRQLSR